MTPEIPTTASPASVSSEPLMQMIQGLRVTAILQAGVQLGIFDQIATGSGQASSLAAAIDADERGTRILLNALAALGLLDTTEGYRPHPAGGRIPRHQPAKLSGRRGQHRGRTVGVDRLFTSGGGGPLRWHRPGPTRRDTRT